jgi:hypothetical protein
LEEDVFEEEEEEDFYEEPSSQFHVLARQIQEQREQAEKDKKELFSLIGSLRASMTQPTHSVIPRTVAPTASVPVPKEVVTSAQLAQIPSTSSAQKVASWQGYRIPTVVVPERSPSPSVAGESTADSLLAQVSAVVDDTPYPPRQLAEGQTPFDWDMDGVRFSTKEDLPQEVRDRILALDTIAKDMAEMNQFPQECAEAPVHKSKILGASTTEVPQEVAIPLPQDIRELVTSSRQSRAKKAVLLSPAVRKGYRVPRQDWAFLGAVRRPDRILEAYCKTKKSAKGVHQLQDQGAAALATAHQETAQATAHILRPLSMCYQSAATVHDLVLQLRGISTDPTMIEFLDKIGQLAQYNLTAAADAADCTTRLNAEALRRLRAVWIDASRLPDEVKDAVKAAPVAPGVVPTERGTEFTAPIAGEALKQHHDMACARVKAEQLLAKRAALHKAGPTKRKDSTQSPSSWKRPKQAPQTRGGRSQQPSRQFRGGQRGGRGARPGGNRGGSQTGGRGQSQAQGKQPQQGPSGKSS